MPVPPFVPGQQFNEPSVGLASQSYTSPAYGYINDSYTSYLEFQTWPVPLGTVKSYVDNEGRILGFQYVLYNANANTTTLSVGPVYWTNNNQTIVSQNNSDGVTGTPTDIAGVLLNPNVTKGNATWIQIYGYLGIASDTNVAQSAMVSGLTSGNNAVKGSLLTGNNTGGLYSQIQVGNNPAWVPFAKVLTSANNNTQFDIFIDIW